jgi:hypothetical protein
LDHLDTGFAAEPFRSVPGLLARSAVVFFGNLPRLAVVTLLVFLPGKLVLQVACAAFEVPESGVLSYALSSLSDLLLGALVTPAAVYLVMGKLRTGHPAPIGESLRWGRWLFGKSLWNEIKMEVTVALYTLLIIIPGVVAQVRLAFTEVVVAVEGAQTGDVLNRSRELSKGHGWKIFFVLLVLGLLDLLVWGGLLRLKLGVALTDSLLAVLSQWSMVATLLMYLGITRASARP